MIYVKHFLPCYAVTCLNFAEPFKTQYIQTIVLGCLFATGDCKHFLPCYAVICSGIVQSHLKLNTVKKLFWDVYSPRRKLHGATGLHVLKLRKGGLLIGTKTPEAPMASNLNLNFFSCYPKFHTFFPPINGPKLYLLFPLQ